MANTNDELKRLEILFQKFYNEAASPEELVELEQLLQKHGGRGLTPLLKQAWTNEKPTDIFSKEQSEALFNRVLSHGSRHENEIDIRHHKVRPLRIIRRIAIAAALIGIIVLSYFLIKPPSITPSETVATVNSTEHDISPGRTGGVLTLSSGQQVVLDEKANGTVANEGQVKVIKRDGQLSYEGENAGGNYLNTLHTPRGRQYRLVLSDGSNVWLNASSSIKYPATFTGNERIVEITGEAYFEIASDRAKPFKVRMHDSSMVNVTGTHFNVNSYVDENGIRTTLLEGSVQVTKGDTRIQLKPGQQSFSFNNQIKLVAGVNLEEVMAWKNGFFSFQNAGLKTIMREISRWYDVDVIYEANVPDVNFSGEIGRGLTLKQVLSILDETRIHYKIEEKKLIITP